MWLQIKTPEVADGNNFGVEVQAFVAGELKVHELCVPTAGVGLVLLAQVHMCTAAICTQHAHAHDAPRRRCAPSCSAWWMGSARTTCFGPRRSRR